MAHNRISLQNLKKKQPTRKNVVSLFSDGDDFVDKNVFSARPSLGGNDTYQYYKSFPIGSPFNETSTIKAIAVDSSGNMYIGGQGLSVAISESQGGSVIRIDAISKSGTVVVTGSHYVMDIYIGANDKIFAVGSAQHTANAGRFYPSVGRGLLMTSSDGFNFGYIFSSSFSASSASPQWSGSGQVWFSTVTGTAGKLWIMGATGSNTSITNGGNNALILSSTDNGLSWGVAWHSSSMASILCAYVDPKANIFVGGNTTNGRGQIFSSSASDGVSWGPVLGDEVLYPHSGTWYDFASEITGMTGYEKYVFAASDIYLMSSEMSGTSGSWTLNFYNFDDWPDPVYDSFDVARLALFTFPSWHSMAGRYLFVTSNYNYPYDFGQRWNGSSKAIIPFISCSMTGATAGWFEYPGYVVNRLDSIEPSGTSLVAHVNKIIPHPHRTGTLLTAGASYFDGNVHGSTFNEWNLGQILPAKRSFSRFKISGDTKQEINRPSVGVNFKNEFSRKLLSNRDRDNE